MTRTLPSAWFRGIVSLPIRTRGTVRSPNVRLIGTSLAWAGRADASAVNTTRRPIDRRKRRNVAEWIYTRTSVGGFEGKRGLILGVANRRSIAWAIAKRLAAGGAELAFTYQGERIEKSVRELAESVSSPLVTECDVRSDEDVARVFSEVSDAFEGGLDLLVHSVAYADAQ